MPGLFRVILSGVSLYSVSFTTMVWLTEPVAALDPWEPADGLPAPPPQPAGAPNRSTHTQPKRALLKPTKPSPFPWREQWRHSWATGLYAPAARAVGIRENQTAAASARRYAAREAPILRQRIVFEDAREDEAEITLGASTDKTLGFAAQTRRSQTLWSYKRGVLCQEAWKQIHPGKTERKQLTTPRMQRRFF